MSTLFLERNPFDILVRNFFQDASQYRPLAESKLPHPVDIYERDNGLGIDILSDRNSEGFFKGKYVVGAGTTIRFNDDMKKKINTKILFLSVKHLISYNNKMIILLLS